MLWGAILTVVMTLVRGVPSAPGENVMAVLAALGIAGTGLAALRQWLRIRRIDRRYWQSRRALLDRADPVADRNSAADRAEEDEQLQRLEHAERGARGPLDHV
jgi:hypothetical protein